MYGFDLELLGQFDHKIYSASDLPIEDISARIISKIAHQPDIITVCQAGLIRSKKFANALINAGGNVLTPNGYSFFNLSKQVSKYNPSYDPNTEASGIFLPSISTNNRIQTIVFHAEKGRPHYSESINVNSILLKLIECGLHHNPAINIIEGDETYYRTMSLEI